MFEEIKNIKTRKKDLKSFGVTMGIIFLAIGGLLFFKEIEYYTELISLAGIFIGFGYFFRSSPSIDITDATHHL